MKASWREREWGKKLADETRLEEEQGRTWRSQICQHQIPSNFSNFINHFSRYGTETQEESILFTNLHESPSVSSDLQEEYTDEGTSVLADGTNICPVKGKNERFLKNPIWLYGSSPSWEAQVLIDERLARVSRPFPSLFSGDVDPGSLTTIRRHWRFRSFILRHRCDTLVAFCDGYITLIWTLLGLTPASDGAGAFGEVSIVNWFCSQTSTLMLIVRWKYKLLLDLCNLLQFNLLPI